MPELPEVETIARALAAGLRGRQLGRAILARADVFHGPEASLPDCVSGRRVTVVRRRGKRLHVSLSGGFELMFHLGMSGRLMLVQREVLLEPHTHFRCAVRGSDLELRFRDPRRFGGIWLWREGAEPTGRCLGPMGIEPLEASKSQFRACLGSRRAIKALLLDQSVVAGLGNIYCDESLHEAGLHPTAPASALGVKEADRLLASIKRVLRKAIRYKGTTLIDYRTAGGQEGGYRRFHRVYRREGEPCRGCGGVIERMIVAGRSTFFCPRCQVSGRDGA